MINKNKILILIFLFILIFSIILTNGNRSLFIDKNDVAGFSIYDFENNLIANHYSDKEVVDKMCQTINNLNYSYLGLGSNKNNRRFLIIFREKKSGNAILSLNVSKNYFSDGFYLYKLNSNYLFNLLESHPGYYVFF